LAQQKWKDSYRFGPLVMMEMYISYHKNLRKILTFITIMV